MITPEKIYEVFGITPGPWVAEHTYMSAMVKGRRPNGEVIGKMHPSINGLFTDTQNAINTLCAAAAPTMLVALVRIQLFAESEYNTEVSETYYKSIIEAADHKKRSWPELKKELLG